MTPKQETFARTYVETGCASTAYRAAYDCSKTTDKSIHENASKLLKNAKVAPRIEELRQGHQKRHEITVDKLTQMAMRAYEMALKDEVQTPSAAVAAVMAIGKLHGLVVDKTKNEHTGADGKSLIPVINVSTSATRNS
jgi:phage terminase small subunit